MSTQNVKSFRHCFSPSELVGLDCSDSEDMTKQSFAEDCDINNLMSRYMSTGQLPQLDQRAPQFLDVTGIDFQEHMNIVAQAQTLFNELPSSLRERFDNDPAKFLAFTGDEKNRREMAELGLLSHEATQRILNPPPDLKAPPAPSELDKPA